MELDILNSVLLLADAADDFCENSKSIMIVIGYVILGIKIIVPIILVVMGMIQMAMALVGGKDDEKIKAAQKGLITKAIAAVIVYLVFTIVTLLTWVVGAKDYQKCVECINKPGTGECKAIRDKL